MKYRQDLQVRLQERYRRLFKTTHSAHGQEMGYLRSYIRSAGALKAIVEAIASGQPDLDPDRWISERFGRSQLEWPPSEMGRAKVAWRLVNRWADGEDAMQLAFDLHPGNNVDDAMRHLTELVVEPFVEYLQECLGTESEVLYLLERYKRRMELFDRDRLFHSYEANPTRGEDLYDSDLRRFLLDQGIDYPYSQPASASGLADIVSGLDGDDPLVCEIKLFDGERYRVPYLAKGFTQALQYAHDYCKTAAYLVIFNLSEQTLDLPSDEAADAWPPRVIVGGVTVYLVTVRARPTPSASKQGKTQALVVKREDLFGGSAKGEEASKVADPVV